MNECLRLMEGKYYQVEEQKVEIKYQFLLSTEIKNDKVSANIKYSGVYALLEEKNKPIISNLTPAINSKYNIKDLNNISFNVTQKALLVK